MKRVVSILVIAAFLAAPMLVAAQQAQPAAPAPPAVAPPAKPAEPAAPAAPAKAKKATAKAETVTVTGMVDVVKDKKGKVTGYVLKTDADTYPLKGKSVKAMVGKKVDATGTVSTTKSGKKVLNVTKVKEAM